MAGRSSDEEAADDVTDVMETAEYPRRGQDACPDQGRQPQGLRRARSIREMARLFIEWLLGKEALALCGTSAAASPQAKGRGRCQIFPMTQETEDPRMTENRQ